MIEIPLSFLSETDCDKATYDGGFRDPQEQTDGWKRYRSTTAKGHIWLAREVNGGWLLAIEHPGIPSEIGVPEVDCHGPGLARYRFSGFGELHAVIPRVYALAMSLPDFPLELFKRKTESLPQTTEAERLVVQRIGQDIFRDSLMKYWQGRCPLTGITDPELLRASHIIPWAEATDAQRLDVHNGLLLSALWDAAFDKWLVTFEDDGMPLFSPKLSSSARAELRWNGPIHMTDKHRVNLARHRERMKTLL